MPTVPSPDCADVAVCSAICATRCALSAICREVASSSLIVVRDLGHRRRLLLDAGRLLVGGRLQLGRRALHLADGGRDLPAKRGRHEPADQANGQHAGKTTPENDRLARSELDCVACVAHREQIRLLLDRVCDNRAQLIHCVLALIPEINLKSSVETLSSGADQSSASARPAWHRSGAHRGQPLLLAGIVRRELANSLEPTPESRSAPPCTVRGRPSRRDDVAALTGLGVCQPGQ